MTRLAMTAATLTFTALFAGSALAADITEISKDDYYGYAYYKQSLEDPRVAKQKSDKKKMRMVARDMHWKSRKLKAAISKVESLDGNAIELATQAVKEGFAGTRIDGKVLDVFINDSEPKHIVMYVRWRGSKGRDAVKEASEIASVVAKKAPLVSTLSLAAIHPKASDTSKVPVWSAKISVTAAMNINPDRIDGYADRLYMRLFEGVEAKPF